MVEAVVAWDFTWVFFCAFYCNKFCLYGLLTK